MMKVALTSAAACLLSSQLVVAGAIEDLLSAALPHADSCQAEAIQYSLDAISRRHIPTEGKFIFVNIPGGTLVAYEDGEPVLEMKTKIGKAEHPTPSYETTLSAVRINPTWTAPWSIVREEGWLQRIKTEPEFFMENGFEVRDRSGNLITFEEAAANPGKIARFVQSPGDLNALGKFRFNINSSSSIYLHDTRDPENFYDGSPLALSHGCVRLENPEDLASWILDIDPKDLTNMVTQGHSIDLPAPEVIPVLMEYLPAWPDSSSDIVIYPDIYGKLPASCS